MKKIHPLLSVLFLIHWGCGEKNINKNLSELTIYKNLNDIKNTKIYKYYYQTMMSYNRLENYGYRRRFNMEDPLFFFSNPKINLVEVSQELFEKRFEKEKIVNMGDMTKHYVLKVISMNDSIICGSYNGKWDDITYIFLETKKHNNYIKYSQTWFDKEDIFYPRMIRQGINFEDTLLDNFQSNSLGDEIYRDEFYFYEDSLIHRQINRYNTDIDKYSLNTRDVDYDHMKDLKNGLGFFFNKKGILEIVVNKDRLSPIPFVTNTLNDTIIVYKTNTMDTLRYYKGLLVQKNVNTKITNDRIKMGYKYPVKKIIQRYKYQIRKIYP